MSLEDQQKRYIKLNGDPIHMKFAQAALNRSITKAAGLSVIFNIATLAQGRPSVMVASLAASVAAYTVATGAKQFFDWLDSLYFDNHTDDLCIDKMPDKSTPPTSPNNLEQARRIRGHNLPFGFVMGFHMATYAASAALISYYAKENIPLHLLVNFGAAGTGAAALTAQLVDTAHRFHKVVKGDWVITTPPKPEKKTEKVPSTAPQPI